MRRAASSVLCLQPSSTRVGCVVMALSNAGDTTGPGMRMRRTACSVLCLQAAVTRVGCVVMAPSNAGDPTGPGRRQRRAACSVLCLQAPVTRVGCVSMALSNAGDPTNSGMVDPEAHRVVPRPRTLLSEAWSANAAAGRCVQRSVRESSAGRSCGPCPMHHSLTAASETGAVFNAVATGGNHSCGLRTDATITCWAFNREVLTIIESHS